MPRASRPRTGRSTTTCPKSPVVIGAHGKKHAMAVGQVLMGRDAVREVNKGHCVENLHFLGYFGLWQAGEASTNVTFLVRVESTVRKY